MARIRYIVTGPDGCGKSTLIARLMHDLDGISVRYLGKRRRSGALYNATSKLRSHTQKLPIVALVTRMCFFSVELADLWAVDRASRDEFYLVERHYFDRLAYLKQLRLLGKISLKQCVRYWVEWPIMTALIQLYLLLFAKHCVIRIVMADAAELHTRKPEDYTNEAAATLRRTAYLMAADFWTSKGGTCEVVNNNSQENFEALVNQEKRIIRSLQNEFIR